MNVLSLFNGMSFGLMALDSLGITVSKYYSSEIDKYANQAAQALFPGTIQLGDVTNWREWDIDWASIDLVTGGFPCQAWSMAGKQLGDKDARGMLFWTMLDIMKHVKYHNPDADFLIENVKMKKEFEEYITLHTENALGHVHKILINSALVSAQNRNRYYWTSFAVEQPEDRGILLRDIIEYDVVDREKSFCLDASYHKGGNIRSYFEKNRRQLVFILKTINHRVVDVTISGDGIRPHKGDSRKSGISELGRLFFFDAEKTYTVIASHTHKLIDELGYRKLTPRECFRLQTVPEHHIDTLLSTGISNTQLYKMCGNGWTMEVIKHILSFKY
jgi:DNA-cytosine methyltransferase